jgi:hypothetical protein
MRGRKPELVTDPTPLMPSSSARLVVQPCQGGPLAMRTMQQVAAEDNDPVRMAEAKEYETGRWRRSNCICWCYPRSRDSCDFPAFNGRDKSAGRLQRRSFWRVLRRWSWRRGAGGDLTEIESRIRKNRALRTRTTLTRDAPHLKKVGRKDSRRTPRISKNSSYRNCFLV